ncbi:MAG: glutathione S-transferase family protein [Gammaproteobacteria bacterium]|nr:glutathione S-transferase family protein [Gammaproteobacteria bacterium]
MKLKLISFELCPFVKKAEIAAKYKNIYHETEYIDLANPPGWFMRISPLKKVPLLLVDHHVIFESSVICEYLDEAYPNKLHPKNFILRAKNRSWIEFADNCLWDSFFLTVKETKKDFYQVRYDLLIKFDQIESVISQESFFNGDKRSLVDVSFTPLFQILEYIEELNPVIFSNKRHPKILKWKSRLLESTEIQEIYSAELKALYFEQIWKRQGYLSRFLENKKYDAHVSKGIY